MMESIKYLPPEYRHFEEVYVNILTNDANQFAYLPVEYQTKKLCMIAIRKNGLNIRHVKHQSKKMQLAAVKQNAWAIECIEPKDRSDDIWLKAVSQDGLVLRLLTRDKRSEQICIAAIRQNLNACMYVDCITPAIREVATECFSKASISSLIFTFDRFLSDDQCLKIIEFFPSKIEYIAYPTYEMYRVAVTEDCQMLRVVPRTIENFEEIALIAIRSKADLIESITPEYQTERMQIEAISKAWYLIWNLVNPSFEVWYAAVLRLPHILAEADDDFVRLCLERNPPLLLSCRESHRTPEALMRLMRSHPGEVRYIRNREVTIELWKEAVSQHPRLIDWCDPFLPFYQTLCIDMIRADWRILRYISHQTTEMHEEALRQSSEASQFISPPSILIRRMKRKELIENEDESQCCICFLQCQTLTVCRHPICRVCYKLSEFYSLSRCPLCRHLLVY